MKLGTIEDTPPSPVFIDILSAGLELGAMLNERGAGVLAKAKASLLTGDFTARARIFGVELEFGVTGDLISIGIEDKYGYFFGEGLRAKGNVSSLYGGGYIFGLNFIQW